MGGEKKPSEVKERTQQQSLESSEQPLPKDYMPFNKSKEIKTYSETRIEKITNE